MTREPDPTIDLVDEDLVCAICGQPVSFISRWGRARSWEHAFLRDTPVPWHDPTPKEFSS
jgi:hypothetical protein